MCYQDSFVPPMSLQDHLNLVTRFIFRHCLGRNPGAYGHDLDSNDPHLTIRSILAVAGIKIRQKIYVRVKSDADAMNEEDGQPRLGGMGSVPVSEITRRGAICGKEG
jgi:hypothetical protein